MTLSAFFVVSGLFLAAVLFAPILIISRQLRKEREAEFNARFETINRKFRLRQMSKDERRTAAIDVLVDLGHSREYATEMMDSGARIVDLAVELGGNSALTHDSLYHPEVSSLEYEIDQLAGRFVRGEIPRDDMLPKMIEIYKNHDPAETAVQSAVKKWKEYEPVWTHKSYVHIPLPPPKPSDAQS